MIISKTKSAPESYFEIAALTEKELLILRDVLEKQHFAGNLNQVGKNMLSEMNEQINPLILK